jgi:3'-phosphoadenosine 5'-phosphosulfate sulfotransferase (PAPS reductase)/FAD synthetase
MTAFPLNQDAFAFPEIEVAVQLPERSVEQKIEGAVQAIITLIEQGWHPVVAWSGGKDSSVTLNLTLTALIRLKEAGANLPTLHICHSDTLVENPVIKTFNRSQVSQIRAYAKAQGIAVKVWLATPSLSNDYLVSVIGGRTILSVGNNTKCQQMMKSSVLTRAKAHIKRQIRQEGVSREGMLSLCGTRRVISSTQFMS